MKYNNSFNELLSEIIKNQDLYGRSFTLGVALYKGIQLGAFDDDQQDAILYYFEEFYPELAAAYENMNCKYNLHAWAEAIDIAALDEIARDLAGYTEND